MTWYYTATRELGAGYHVIKGRAVDAAGNQETPYEIGTVLWLPREWPDISGSSVVAYKTKARPGDEVTFAVTARNAGPQEALVGVTATLPAGLTPVCDPPQGFPIQPGVTCDVAARTVAWPARMLWPGQSLPRAFRATVDAGLVAQSLEAQVTFHAFWPNTDQLPVAQRQLFLDREQTVTAKATLAIDPALPADADVTAPWVILRQPAVQQVNTPDLALRILAPDDAQRMYLREWTPDPTTGAWTVRQDSGWLPYSRDHTWTLSPARGSSTWASG